jgi:hypothetical protein
MPVPSQDQIVAQVRLVIPAIGVIVSAVGIAKPDVVGNTVAALMTAAGPIAYAISVIWSLYANSRASIMTAAAKPVAPGVPAPKIELPHEEAALAESLPANVTSPPVKP